MTLTDERKCARVLKTLSFALYSQLEIMNYLYIKINSYVLKSSDNLWKIEQKKGKTAQ